jgi:hypothetical protein
VVPVATEIRPRLLWMVLSWVLFLVLAVGGSVAAGAGMAGAVTAAAPAQTFAGGEWVELTTGPGDGFVVYAMSASPISIRCDIAGGSTTRPTLEPAADDRSLNVDGIDWQLGYRIQVPEPGPYQLMCEGPGVQFGVGTELDERHLLGAVGLAVGGVLTGLVIALVTTISVVSLRRGARRRQLAPWLGTPVPGPGRPW